MLASDQYEYIGIDGLSNNPLHMYNVNGDRGLGSAGSSIVQSVGGSVLAAAPLAGPTMPFVAAAGALIALAGTIAGALHIGEGCGPTCVQATSIVNQAEPILKQNVAAFQAGQISRTDALNLFNQIWTAVEQSCGAIPGAAGQNCIGDRQRGGKWDWFSYYYDPIANSPDNQLGISQASNSASGIANSLVTSTSSLLSMVESNPVLALAGLGMLIFLGAAFD